MQAYIHFVSRPNELIRQSRPAAGAKNDPSFSEGAIDLFVPPACVPEFNDVAPRGIKLTNDILNA